MALVFHGAPLLSQSNALKIYSSPVAYLDARGVLEELISLAKRIGTNCELISKHSDSARTLFYNALRFAMLSIKHPGFGEELEWRVIYQPWSELSRHVSHDIETISGLPQIVQKIPLRDIPEEGLKGLEITDGLDRIIIGPTQFPDSMLLAFSEVLAKRGVKEPHNRIHISNIPLRSTNQ